MGIRVLIVDPDESLLETYCRGLASWGFELATARDGPECINRLSDFSPDVLVLEPELPNQWDERILALLRDVLAARQIPVIVLTRGDAPRTVLPIRESFVKPLSLRKLAETIRRVAHGTQGSHAA